MPEPLKRGPKPSDQKRQALIAAALAAFAQRGADLSTTREIADAAGTTERTLFKHFGSKQGLVQAAIELVSLNSMREAAFARVRDTQPFTRAGFADWHRNFLLERLETAHRSPANYRVLARELLRDDGFRRHYVQGWSETVYAPLEAQLRDMQRAGEIDAAVPPAALAGAFFSLNLGFLMSRFVLAPEQSFDDRAAIELIAVMFMRICGAAPTSGTGF